jgi:dienelactone hydrolase
MTSKMIPASAIPPKYLKSAFLVGNIPFKAAAIDQRFSYCMYIPEKQYIEAQASSKLLPLIVIVHGTSRRVERSRDALVDLADHHGAVVLAPFFPAGIEDPNDIHNYKAIKYRDIRYDQVLLGIIDEVKQRWAAIATDKFYLVGYSGGGQFALRFLYLHPDKIEAAAIGAPGSITDLDDSKPWPAGIQDVESVFDGRKIDVDKIRTAGPIYLTVGDCDDKIPGNGLIQWLAENMKGKRQEQPHAERAMSRKAGLIAFQKRLKELGIDTQLEIIPDAGHDMSKAMPGISIFLEELLTARQNSRIN